MRARFQPSVFVRAVCSVPLLLLVVLLIWGGATTGGLAGWLAWGGALAVLVAFGRGWIIRVEDLGDRIRVVNWMQTVEVSWSDVDRFEFDGGVGVRRTDLTVLPMSAFPAVSETCSASPNAGTGRPFERSRPLASDAGSRLATEAAPD